MTIFRNALINKSFLIMSGFLLWIVMTVAIVYAMPAAWAVEALSSRTAGRVQLAHVRGLWHRGSGILVLSSGAGGADAVHWAQRIQWDVALLRVPTQWALRVTWPEVGPPFRVTLQAGLASWAATVSRRSSRWNSPQTKRRRSRRARMRCLIQ